MSATGDSHFNPEGGATAGFNVAVLAIAMVWLGVRVVHWNGFYVEDAPGYITDAEYLAVANYHARGYVNGLNVGTYFPVAPFLGLLGKTELAIGLWPLFCSLLGVVSLAGISGIMFGRWFGVLAALLYATYPGDVFFSTVVMPDSIQAGWVSLSMFAITLAYARSGVRGKWYLLAGGLAMGVCHLIRANDVILLPVGVMGVVILSGLWRRQTWRSVAHGCLVYVAGWALVHVLEALLYLGSTGDFFHRFRVVAAHYGTPASIRQWGLNTDGRTIPFSVFAPLQWLDGGRWWEFNAEQAYHGLLFCLALVSSAIGAGVVSFNRNALSNRALAGVALSVIWLAWPLLYHQFGSQSVTQFVPIHRLSRHLVVYAPGAVFAVVAGCFAVKQAMGTWRTMAGRALIAVASAILVGHVYFNWRSEQIAYRAYHRIKATYLRILERLPRDVEVIAGDPGDLAFFDFWLNPLGVDRVAIVAFANYSTCDEIARGVVLTRSSIGWEGAQGPAIREVVARLPCLLDPPATWRLLYDGYPEKIYVVGQH
jgi:4-amino-4-deoxy-L-arabinose transferase-like glycosyltransferase